MIRKLTRILYDRRMNKWFCRRCGTDFYFRESCKCEFLPESERGWVAENWHSAEGVINEMGFYPRNYMLVDLNNNIGKTNVGWDGTKTWLLT